MSSEWIHIKTIIDNEHFEINGINIWNYDWKDTHERIQLKHPTFYQNYTFIIYNININDICIEFAAGEFSNCVWGIYQKQTRL